MPEFSLSLSDDQQQIQKWVHDFADTVVRPAAHEWDEREEFPWPIVQEAAKIGLYGWEFLMNGFSDPTGLTMPVAIEELFRVMPVLAWPSWDRLWPPLVSVPTVRRSRSLNGCRSVMAPPTM